MPSPNFTFAFLIATLCGALFHVIVGGDARRLTVFLVAGWIGFGIGQILGTTMGAHLLTIGELNLASAGMGAFITLMVAYVLTSDRSRRRRSPR